MPAIKAEHLNPFLMSAKQVLQQVCQVDIQFGPISKDDFYDLMKECPMGNWDTDECYKIYKSLTNKHDRLIFHISANRIIINRTEK